MPIAKLAAALFLTLAGAGQAAAQVEAEELVVEALPPHLRARIDENEQALQLPALDDAQRWIVEDLSLWDLSQGPLRVCFMDGDVALKRRIMTAAKGWEVPESSVRFDFGNMSNPRICGGTEPSHIRIGFRYKGYWSLVGQHSVNSARQFEQSMNFEAWDVRDVDDTTLRRIVLHEFGHALGLHHEHQNPQSACEQQFDWDYAYRELAMPPNQWPPSEVDLNLRRLVGGSYSSSAFDAASIMIYSLPARFYKDREHATCFRPNTSMLSAGDKTAIATKYPRDLGQQLALRKATFENYGALVRGRNLNFVQQLQAANASAVFAPSIGLADKVNSLNQSQRLWVVLPQSSSRND